MLTRLWQRSLPILEQRLAVLDSAAAAAQSATLSDELRTQAITDVHKLSGSLGMFGYPQATELARDIEALLETPGPPDPAQLSRLVTGLRAALFPAA